MSLERCGAQWPGDEHGLHSSCVDSTIGSVETQKSPQGPMMPVDRRPCSLVGT